MIRLLISVLLLSSVFVAGADLSTSSFVVFSDIHFNPLSDDSLKRKLIAAGPEDWEAILASGKSEAFSRYGQDTNWPLLRSAISRIASLPDKPKLILITGDLLAHNLRRKFEADASSPPDFSAFVRNEMLFVERIFKSAIPGIPVIISLGNNDGDCGEGDYTTEPRGIFLEKTLPAIADAAGVPLEASRESWRNYGSYEIPHPLLENRRIVVLNTTFFSTRYRNACGAAAEDPGQAMLSWLEGRLSDASRRHEQVWLVYHIPPGIDGYATTHPKGSNPESVVTMWRPQYQTAFENLLRKYSDVVQNQIAGHTHFDDFRLLGKPDAYSSFVLLTPGLSPNVRQNPAFRTISFRQDGALTDESTYYLTNLEQVAADTPADWKVEYSFRQVWKLKLLDLANLTTLYRQIQTVAPVREQWKKFYSVSSEDGLTEKAFTATACATGNSSVPDYRKCFCAQVPTAVFCSN